MTLMSWLASSHGAHLLQRHNSSSTSPLIDALSKRWVAELGGTPLPNRVVDRISRHKDDPDALRQEGIEIAVELASELMEIGAPGLHFYTMNSAESTLEIISRIGIRP